jgi:hypothetical protein
MCQTNGLQQKHSPLIRGDTTLTFHRFEPLVFGAGAGAGFSAALTVMNRKCPLHTASSNSAKCRWPHCRAQASGSWAALVKRERCCQQGVEDGVVSRLSARIIRMALLHPVPTAQLLTHCCVHELQTRCVLWLPPGLI